MRISRHHSLQALLLVIGGLGAGCAGPDLDDTPSRLDTHIFDNGAKQFTFQLLVPRRRGAPPSEGRHPAEMSGPAGGPPPSSGRPQRPANDNKRIKKKVLQRLEQALAETGYCRAGYFIYGDQLYDAINPYATKGECKDVATEDDRKRFPNPSPENPRGQSLMTTRDKIKA